MHTQQLQILNVWTSIFGARLIATFETEDGETYLELLESVIILALPDISETDFTVVQIFQADIIERHFQQHGAPPHYALRVSSVLGSTFSTVMDLEKKRHKWPPWSPNLSSLDFS